MYNDLRQTFNKPFDAVIKSPADLLSPTSQYGSPKPGTSKVIDTLHAQIDDLRAQLEDAKHKSDDHKTKHESVKKRHDQLVEQLANTKHENDMVNAMLERKGRRISDLEEKLSETIDSTEDYKFNLTSLEVRCKKLQESEQVATSEFERMKIAYETVVTSQKEYREYYSKEIEGLKEKLRRYVDERREKLQETQKLLRSNDTSVQRKMRQFSEQSETLEQQYAVAKNAVIETLKSLSVTCKSHGLDTQIIIDQCNLVFNELRNRFGIDVDKLIEHYKDKEVDNTIEKLLGIDSPSSTYLSLSSPVLSPNIGMGIKKRGSRKSSLASRNFSSGSGKEQENIDPRKKADRRSVSGPAKRHSRKISVSKDEITSPGAPKKRNSLQQSNVDLTKDWRAKPEEPVAEDEESEEEDETDAEDKGDLDGKKKKRRRRRKRKGKTDEPRAEVTAGI